MTLNKKVKGLFYFLIFDKLLTGIIKLLFEL